MVGKFKKIIFGCIACFAFVGSVNAAALTTEMPGNYKFIGNESYGTDTLTSDAENPGTATATLAKRTTYLITDATGTYEDVITVPDGTREGQIKEFILLTDAETTGAAVAPTNTTMVGGAGTSTLLEDVGDCVVFKWNSAMGWTLMSWIGATVQ